MTGRWAVAAMAVGVGCGSQAPPAPRPVRDDAVSATTARVRVRGAPAHGDVLWIADQAVVAAAPLGADGSCAIPPTAAGAAALVRIDAPVVGVVEVPAGRAIDVDVGAGQLATIRGTIAVPAGVTFDWADLHLTPRLADLAPRLVLADGTSPSMRGTFATRRLTEPAFAAEVIVGTWEVRLDREVDAPLGAAEVALATGAVTAAGGLALVENHGGWQVPVAGDVALTITLTPRSE